MTLKKDMPSKAKVKLPTFFVHSNKRSIISFDHLSLPERNVTPYSPHPLTFFCNNTVELSSLSQLDTFLKGLKSGSLLWNVLSCFYLFVQKKRSPNEMLKQTLLCCNGEDSKHSCICFALCHLEISAKLWDCKSTSGFQPSQDHDQVLKLCTVCGKIILIMQTSMEMY